MSTRSQIAFEGTKIKIYKHSDGYPSDNLDAILPFMEMFMEHRGYDECYLIARLVQHLTNRADNHMAECKKKWGGRIPDGPELLGYGIDDEWHGDIEYSYHISSDGSVEVRTGHETLGKFPLGTSVEDAVAACERAENGEEEE